MDNLARTKRIYLKEKDVKRAFDKAYDDWFYCMLVINSAVDLSQVAKDTHYRMGSLADGGFSARIFAEDEHIFEGDFLIEVLDLPPHLISPIAGKPGFYRVINDGKFASHMIGIANIFLNDARTSGHFSPLIDLGIVTMGPGYVLGKTIKKTVEHVAGLSDGLQDVRFIMAQANDIHIDRTDCKMRTEFNGPATTQIMDFYIDGVHRLEMSYDVVVGARLPFWPEEAASFKDRERKWPPGHVVEEIIKEHKVHLVAKPSDEISPDHSDEWRLTFLAEKRIVQEQSPVMRFTYYIFKILFYKYFKMEVAGKSLSSYLAKTTMYWLCEEADPDMWTEENVSVNLQTLLLKLCDYLERGSLPHYFVPAIDLLGNLPEQLLRVARNIKVDQAQLFADPIANIPDCFKRVSGRMDYIIKVCKEWGNRYRNISEHLSNGVVMPRQNDTNPCNRFYPDYSSQNSQHSCDVAVANCAEAMMHMFSAYNTRSYQTGARPRPTNTSSDQRSTRPRPTNTSSDQTGDHPRPTNTISDQTGARPRSINRSSDQTGTRPRSINRSSDQTGARPRSINRSSDQTGTRLRPTNTSSDQTGDRPRPTNTSSDQTGARPRPTNTSSDQTYTRPRPINRSSHQRGTRPRPTNTSSDQTYTRPRPTNRSSYQTGDRPRPTNRSSYQTGDRPRPTNRSSYQTGDRPRPTNRSSYQTGDRPRPTNTSSDQTGTHPQPTNRSLTESGIHPSVATVRSRLSVNRQESFATPVAMGGSFATSGHQNQLDCRRYEEGRRYGSRRSSRAELFIPLMQSAFSLMESTLSNRDNRNRTTRDGTTRPYMP